MLKIKKSLLTAVLFVTAVLVSAQSGTAELTKRYLEKANTQYENAQYDEAYKTINAVLKLNETGGIPANAALVATQIYSKQLDKVKAEKNYTKFSDIAANLEKYPVIADGSIQSKVKAIYAQQEAELQAKKEAAEKAEKAEQQAAIQKQIDELTKSSTAVMEAMAASTESTMAAMESSLDKIAASTEKSAKSNHMVLIAVFIICIVLAVVFVIVVMIIRAAAKASARQSMQFEETLKLVQGMTQQNSQLLLGNVTELQGLGGPGVRYAGSSRWGVDALPAPEMNDTEKEELKQLAIRCEDLGAKIDMVSRRKNNSKNVSELVYKLSIALGFNQNTAMLYFCAAMVYDAGFLSVPEEILGAESLTDEQKEIIKDHVNNYSEYYDFVPQKYLNIFEDAARYHHENEDGSGYPDGTKSQDIPQIAKIIHVVESYNSLISRRNYKQIKDKESAIEELLEKNDMYDEAVVKALDSIV